MIVSDIACALRTRKPYLTGMILTAAGVALATPAQARNNEAIFDLEPELHYAVAGFVLPKCKIASGDRQVEIVGLQDPADDTIAASNTELRFSVDCNTPVRTAMFSRQGGLRHDGLAGNDPAFESLVPYRARLNLPSQQGALSCRSDAMVSLKNGCRGSSESPTNIGEGSIQIQVARQNRLLLAGKYQDQLVVVVTPKLGGDD